MRRLPPSSWKPRMSPAFRRRRLLAAVGIGAIVATFAVALATGANAASTLLSQGRPVTASSTEGADTPASAAVDGNPGTRWSSQFSDPQWLQVDLGASASITQVVLQWEAAYATAFQIQTSPDGSAWTSIYSTTTGTGGTQTLNVTGTGRYVRMYGTARNGGYGYSLYEFQVYGSSDTGGGVPTCGTDNAALNRPASASSTENAGANPASAAFDGNPGTRWASQFSDPQWIQVDLGTTQSICQVVLTWEAAYATGFQIQVSPDAVNWTPVYSTTTGTGGTQTLNVSGSGRYVRMYGTVRVGGYGYSLWEFVVHTGGGGSSPTPSPTPTTSPTGSGNWTSLWSDSFTGNAGTAPSGTNWKYDTGASTSGGLETTTNSTTNVALDGAGHLNLTAVNSGGGWTSGKIETQRSDFTPPAGGMLKISAVLKQPNPANGIGYWPKFYASGAAIRGNSASWPAAGETDIMEDVNGRSQTAATLHCDVAPGGACQEYNGRTSSLLTCPSCQTGYHTYAEIIDRSTSDEQIRWYLDNDQIWSVSESQVGVAAWQAAVDHGFYLTFSLGVAGSFPDTVCGCTSASAGPSSGGQLSIDSVDVSQLTGSAPPPLTTPPVPSGGSVVKVTGSQGNWKLTVNGSPYQVKGLTFGPSSATSGAYLASLKAMGVNTLRTWGTDATSKPLLDNAAAYGLKVVNGFWLNQGADYVNDTAYKTSTLNSIVSWVNTYKNHPGVLMWDVGNEVILTTQDHYSGAQVEAERIAYARYVEQVVQAVHAADPNHPVTSTDAYTGAWPYYKQYTPSLDLLAVNSYGAVCGVKQDWINGGYTKPYILTEGGPSGEWEVPNDANGVPTEPSDPQKAAGYTSSYNCLMSHTGVALGGTWFHYGIENDFGGVWLNTFTGGWRRLAYYSVAQMFGGNAGANTPPVISGMTAGQNVAAGSTFPVSVNVSDPNGDPIHYNLMLTHKYIDGGTGLNYASFTQTGTSSFSVTAPQTLGVWKVYVYAYDGHGNVGIETKSFTVVPPPVSGTNVGRGKPATASSTQAPLNGATFDPGNAVDGNLSTRWATDWSDPQWIRVDLGQSTAIHHVQLVWESAYAKAYQIQTSNDGNTWTTVYSTTTGDGGVDDINLTGTGRYVRMNGTARGTAYGYSLYEFGIYS
ncbi:discoidin domain-containing protein [Rugosimonospora africana]|nr:discoidin domain-containing protein [Rugosimonospora africana]